MHSVKSCSAIRVRSMIVDAALMQILRGEGEKGRIVAIGNKKSYY